jgi:hypothetical protein
MKAQQILDDIISLSTYEAELAETPELMRALLIIRNAMIPAAGNPDGYQIVEVKPTKLETESLSLISDTLEEINLISGQWTEHMDTLVQRAEALIEANPIN